MTEDAGATAAAAAAPTAGRLLREAREKQGLHIAALAASIKVAPKKLELLEGDRFAELPDATFTRALAQTVCRALKVDSAPVMRLLPPPAGQRLDQVGEGLNAPFRDRPGVLVQRDGPGVLTSFAFWVPLLLLAAAAGLYFTPPGFFARAGKPIAASSSAAAGSAPLLALATPVISTAEPMRPPAGEVPGMPPDAAVPPSEAPPVAAVAVPVVAGGTTAVPAVAAIDSAKPPEPAAALTPAVTVAAAPSGLLLVQTSSASWVEVTDARGQPLIARLLKAGEVVGVDGTPPLRLRIGNANATKVVFRGQPTELAAYTRDNVARLELK